MVEKRKIVAVHPKDARNYKKHDLIGRVGHWVREGGPWEYGPAKGYEHGVFRFNYSSLGTMREISCFAISTIPVKKGG